MDVVFGCHAQGSLTPLTTTRRRWNSSDLRRRMMRVNRKLQIGGERFVARCFQRPDSELVVNQQPVNVKRGFGRLAQRPERRIELGTKVRCGLDRGVRVRRAEGAEGKEQGKEEQQNRAHGRRITQDVQLPPRKAVRMRPVEMTAVAIRARKKPMPALGAPAMGKGMEPNSCKPQCA